MADENAPVAEAPAKMTSKAIVLVGHGGYDKLKIQQNDRPTPGKGEVLVNVKASGVNFAELMCRQGMYDRCPKTPTVLGMEAGGVITEVGEDVEKFKGGERVVCVRNFGLWSEYAAVPAKMCFAIPDEMTFEEAAALPVTYLTAHVVLFNFGNLRPKQSVLVHMAAGGVGTAATQLCKTVDDVTIFGTASEAKHERIKENGVTHPIDYRQNDYVTEIRKISPEGVDVVMDPLAGEDSTKGYNLLKPLGRIIHFGAANVVSGQTKNYMQIIKTWWSTKTISTMQLMGHNKGVSGVHLGYMFDNPDPLLPVMEELLDLYRQGKIKPVIDTVWAFEDIDRAMARMHERQNVGKVVISTEKEPEPRPEPVKKERKKSFSKKDKKKVEKREGAAEEEKKEEEKKEEEKKEEEKKEEEKKEEEKKEEAKEEKEAEVKKDEPAKEEKVEAAAGGDAEVKAEEKKDEE